jgi:hypothetical protein
VEGIITPHYVWLTAGAATWTNERAAEALAKRAAGVDKFKIVQVSTVLDLPFVMIGKEEFYERLGGAKNGYMIGEIHHVLPKQGARGDISALSTRGWGGISWCVSYDTKSLVNRSFLPVSKREIISEFEHVIHDESPDPLTLEVDIPKEREKPNGCMILAAMVIGELGYNEQAH